MCSLSVEEAIRVSDAFLITLYTPEVYDRWWELKKRMKFTNEKDFVTWLLDFVDTQQLQQQQEAVGAESVGQGYGNVEYFDAAAGNVNVVDTWSLPAVTAAAPDLATATATYSKSQSKLQEDAHNKQVEQQQQYHHYITPPTKRSPAHESKSPVKQAKVHRERAVGTDGVSTLSPADSDKPHNSASCLTEHLNNMIVYNTSTDSSSGQAKVGRGRKGSEQTRGMKVGTIKCEYCSKLFVSHRNMLRHVNDVHYRIKGYECSFCDKTFAQPNSLKRHLQACHRNAGASGGGNYMGTHDSEGPTADSDTTAGGEEKLPALSADATTANSIQSLTTVTNVTPVTTT